MHIKAGASARRGSGPTPEFAPMFRFYLPLKIALAYLLGTFGVFLLGPGAAEVKNLPSLTFFVLSAVGLFALGYRLSTTHARHYKTFTGQSREVTPLVRAVIVFSAVWFLVFSTVSLFEYGATGIGDIINAALNPARSYLNKFQVYREQAASGRTSLPLQIAVLTGAFYFVLIPLTVYYWRNLSSVLRSLAVSGVVGYIFFFAFIGTQKGIGDIFIMLLAALAASVGSQQGPTASSGRRKRTRKWLVIAAIVLSCGFVIYLANVQGERIRDTSGAGKFGANPVLTQLFGETFSRGMTVAVFYPTHGYLGLSKNLSVPFVWSGGASIPAIASYKTQYFGGDDPMRASYPVRTEAVTGWPAGLVWSTIYPWLASDLTFPGAALFMGAFGWFMARMWIGVRYERDPLSLVLFAASALILVYVPANNQLMQSRYTALGLITLLAIYVLRRLLGPRASRQRTSQDTLRPRRR
ncbi:hypothetical protein [Cryobacterium sp. CG_9.6]|uniref:hypothetical protein n=1 Tax=Cryobacterium sp. CG_9.6 TaxID=2760710 RepID=UPI0024756277|nr:hypothetical protein [Cryobacterium sp. CG_9.6]MDH6235797.1 hypothetical protein [Cryobacterium sp. CG_9.6]